MTDSFSEDELHKFLLEGEVDMVMEKAEDLCQSLLNKDDRTELSELLVRNKDLARIMILILASWIDELRDRLTEEKDD